MRRMMVTAAAACLLAPAVLAAQQLQHVEEQFHQHLFAPEMIMEHQEELRITTEQRQTITEIVRELQHAVIDLQWDLQAENRRLVEMVEAEQIDADAAVAQFEHVLDLERQVKTLHFRTLVRLKNALTSEQQESMDRILQHMQQMQQEQGVRREGRMPGMPAMILESPLPIGEGLMPIHEGEGLMPIHEGEGLMPIREGGTMMHRDGMMMPLGIGQMPHREGGTH